MYPVGKTRAASVRLKVARSASRAAWASVWPARSGEAPAPQPHRSTARQQLGFSAEGDPDVTKGQVIGFYCNSKVISGLWYIAELDTDISDGKATQGIMGIRDGSKKVPLEFPIPGVDIHGEWAALDYGTGENKPAAAASKPASTTVIDPVAADMNDQSCSENLYHVISYEGEGPDGQPQTERAYRRQSESIPALQQEASVP